MNENIIIGKPIMKDMFLFSFITLLCAACASSSVERNPGLVGSESGYVDLEILYLAEAPIDLQIRDLALAGALSNPGAISLFFQPLAALAIRRFYRGRRLREYPVPSYP